MMRGALAFLLVVCAILQPWGVALAQSSPNFSIYFEKTIFRPNGESVAIRELLPEDFLGGTSQAFDIARGLNLAGARDDEFSAMSPSAPFPVTAFFGPQAWVDAEPQPSISPTSAASATCIVGHRSVACQVALIDGPEMPGWVGFLQPVTVVEILAAGGLNRLPSGMVCDGRLTLAVTGKGNQCRGGKSGKRGATPTLLTALAARRHQYLDLPHEYLAYVPASSVAGGDEQIGALLALATMSDPERCDGDSMRCGVFRRANFQGNAQIDYCQRMISGSISFTEQYCEPLAWFRDGQWHLTVALGYSSSWGEGGAEGDWACAINLPHKTSVNDVIQNLTSVIAPPLSKPEIRWLAQNTFVISASSENLSIRVFDSRLPTFGSAKVVAYGSREGRSIILYFTSNFIISPRRMKNAEDGFVPTNDQSLTLQEALNGMFYRNLKARLPGARIICDTNYGGV